MKLRSMMLASVMIATGGAALAQVTPVTDEMLANPDPADWLTYGRAQDNYRHSPLTQITPENVGDLQLVWARGMEAGPVQASPIIYDGVMYMPNPGDVIQAIDAATGDLIWEYRRAVGDTMLLNSLGDRKRGISIYEDKLYFATWDNHLVALDLESGQLAWEIDRGQGTEMVSNTSGPIVANGVVVLGSTCQFSPFGCFITGHDSETGEELWRNEFIPRPGEEGDETWGNDYEARWMTGVWGQITYDPELDLVFYGSSGAGPASEAQRGTPGGTLYGTNTRFAVRPETGEIVWRHQTLPRDNWDQECTYEMITADIAATPSETMEGMLAIGDGATGDTQRVLTGVPCKTGVMWQFDAETGDFIYARATVEQNLIDNIDGDGLVTVNEDAVLSTVGETVYHCPTYLGGRDWNPSTYDPNSNLYYITLTNACYEAEAIDQEFGALDVYNTDTFSVLPEGVENVGRIDAIDITTGETAWSYEQPLPIYAPLMSTDSGVLFSGGVDRVFKALDSATGEMLWSTKLAAAASGHPVTYEVDGRQYVAIPAGGPSYGASFASLVGEQLDLPTTGNAVYVFALPEAD
ncbi:outer membrane protein assembly factor BamB family protein [Pseudoroseicyclus sp. H15]